MGEVVAFAPFCAGASGRQHPRRSLAASPQSASGRQAPPGAGFLLGAFTAQRGCEISPSVAGISTKQRTTVRIARAPAWPGTVMALLGMRPPACRSTAAGWEPAQKRGWSDGEGPALRQSGAKDGGSWRSGQRSGADPAASDPRSRSSSLGTCWAVRSSHGEYQRPPRPPP